MNKISFWSLALSVVFITSTLIGGCSDSKIESQKLVNEAKQYIEKRDLRAATIELKNALQENTENGEARFLLGQLYLEMGDMSSAEKELRRAKKNKWDEELVQLHLAESLLRQQKYEELLKDIVVEKTFSASTQSNLLGMTAIAHADLGQKDKVIKSLSEAEKIYKDAQWLFRAKIGRLLQEKETESANDILKQALAIYKDNQDMWLMSAEIANTRGDNKSSKTALKKVLELEPPKITTSYGWRAHLGLARLLISEEEFAKAQGELAPLLKINDKNPEANYLAALIAFKQDNKDLAEAKLLQVLKVAPNYQPALLLLGPIQYAKQNYEQSAYYLSQYVAAVPDNSEARKLLGQSYMALGQHDEAQAILRAGVGDPDPDLMALIGLSELQGGENTAGISNLKKAVKAAPDNVSIQLTLAKAYIANGDTAIAIKELRKLQDNPKVGLDAQRLIVLAHMRNKDVDNALKLAQLVLEDHPQNPEIIAMLANVYVSAGDKQQARNYFEKALQVKPDYIAVSMVLARLDELDGQMTQAKARYESVLDISPDSAPAMFALARISNQLGKQEEVGKWLEKSNKAAPNELLPQITLAQYYLRQNKVDKAEFIVNQLVETNPEHISTLALQGKIHMVRGKFNQALSPLQKLVKIVPKSVTGHILLGEALLGASSMEEASKEFYTVLKLNSENVIALNNLAWYYDQKKDSRALEYAEKAYKLNPSSPSIQDTYGWILVQNGKVNKGHRLLMEASRRLPQVKEIRYHLAVAMLELGEENKARAILQELVNSDEDFQGKKNAQKLLK